MMSDGRIFTNWSSNQTQMDQLRIDNGFATPNFDNNELRYHLQKNASTIMQAQRVQVAKTYGCRPPNRTFPIMRPYA
jgi:hypothetical protein